MGPWLGNRASPVYLRKSCAFPVGCFRRSRLCRPACGSTLGFIGSSPSATGILSPTESEIGVTSAMPEQPEEPAASGNLGRPFEAPRAHPDVDDRAQEDREVDQVDPGELLDVEIVRAQ